MRWIAMAAIAAAFAAGAVVVPSAGAASAQGYFTVWVPADSGPPGVFSGAVVGRGQAVDVTARMDYSAMYGYEGQAGCVGWGWTAPDGGRVVMLFSLGKETKPGVDGKWPQYCETKPDPNAYASGVETGRLLMLWVMDTGGGQRVVRRDAWSGPTFRTYAPTDPAARYRLYLLYNEVYWADNVGGYEVAVATVP